MSLGKCMGIAGTLFVGIFSFWCVLRMVWAWVQESNEGRP